MKGIIYKYTSPSGKSYIGQTVKENKRKAQHKRSAFNETDAAYDTPFHKAIRKYGWDSFKYEVLYTIIDSNEELVREELNKREVYYIGKYNTFEKGYNCNIGGSGNKPENPGSNKNRELSKEHKEKLKNSVRKKVWQFDLDGNFIAEFESCADACRTVDPEHDNASRISYCCDNRKGTVKGFQWRWPGEYPGKYMIPKRHSPKVPKGKNNPNSKSVIEIDKEGNIVNRWDSLMDLIREENFNSGTISKYIKKQKPYRNRLFKYEN